MSRQALDMDTSDTVGDLSVLGLHFFPPKKENAFIVNQVKSALFTYTHLSAYASYYGDIQ